MSEDEAFIRAIVDNPGDDTPRLVYADWLDDRSDPRGAYLRAEAEWAQPWKAGYPPGWGPREEGRGLPQWADGHWQGLDEIMAAAVGLDPVWVARVSRPPAGVCCDHVRFSDSGPLLTPDEVSRAETRYGRPFPIDLRAFLLNHNGGRPSRRQLIIRSSEEGSWDREVVTGFAWHGSVAGSGPRGRPWVDTLREEVEYGETELDGFGVPNVAADYVPIGEIPATTILLMRVGDPPSREVFKLWTEVDWPPEPLTRSLPELFARMTTEPI